MATVQNDFIEIPTNKYVILGTGSGFERINKKLKILENAEFFIESTPKRDSYLDKAIVNLNEFLNSTYSPQEYTILVCTSMWDEIVQNSDSALLQKYHKINLYEELKTEIINESIGITRCKDLMRRFIKTYSKKEYADKLNTPVNSKKDKVLIMIQEWAGSVMPFHHIVLGMMLKSKGVEIEYLFNDQAYYGDIALYPGAVEFQNTIIEEILQEVNDITQIPYHKVSEYSHSSLTDNEYAKIMNMLYYNKVWLSKSIIFDSNSDELKFMEHKWNDNAQKIKSFLEKKQFNKVVSFTGAHFEWAILNVLSRELEKSVYTHEYARGGYSFSISGATVLQKDVKLFDDMKLDKSLLDYFTEYSNEHIRKKFPSETANYNDEPSVLIPLNIFWDSAAFGENDIFLYFDEWLLKTINYVINELNVKVIVRQHPHERKHGTGKDVENLLLSKFGNNPLFEYYAADSDVDSYQLMKKASIILPNTSSVGLEGAMMGKNVIVKNEVYYANSGFVKKASSVEDYFSLISAMLGDNSSISDYDIFKAKVYFGLTMHNSVDRSFGHDEEDLVKWMEKPFSTVLNYKPAKWLLDIIINNKLLLENYMEEKINEINV